MKRYERTRALVEGDPALARAIVCEVERDGSQGAVAVLDEPREELVMVQARETAQGSLFFLGEALMTSCRVRVGDAVGLGLVLGSDRCRAYELAVVDAVFFVSPVFTGLFGLDGSDGAKAPGFFP